jgi:hypothetical protein
MQRLSRPVVRRFLRALRRLRHLEPRLVSLDWQLLELRPRLQWNLHQ